jgi:hypothetical protein
MLARGLFAFVGRAGRHQHTAAGLLAGVAVCGTTQLSMTWHTLMLLTPFCFSKSTKLAAMKNTAAGVSVTPSSGLAVTR